jgi:hypothetical protein
MAHKGWLYPIHQLGRPFAGDVPWPKYPAYNYGVSGDQFVNRDGINIPWDDKLMTAQDADQWTSAATWATEPFHTPHGLAIIHLRLWYDEPQRYPKTLHQLYINGEPQYEEVDESTFFSNTLQYVTTWGPYQVLKPDWVLAFDGYVQSAAVPW